MFRVLTVLMTIGCFAAIGEFALAASLPRLILEPTDTPSGSALAISFHPGDLNGTFDTVGLEVDPTLDVDLINYSAAGGKGGVPFRPGAEATFVNPLIQAPEVFGGLGWVVLEKFMGNLAQLHVATGPLGEQIEIDEPLFLANALLPYEAKGSYDIHFLLIDAGRPLFEVDDTFVFPRTIPEPATSAAAAAGIVGLAMRRRRRRASTMAGVHSTAR